MKFIALIKADAASEAGEMPSTRLLTEMGAFNEEMVAAGVLLGGEGLEASSNGVRVNLGGSGASSVDHGPFADISTIVAGFWILNVASLDEAVAWMRRCPNPDGGQNQIEIRRICEMEDFGEAFTPELQAQETRLREQIGS